MIQRVQVTEVSSPDLGVDVESDPFSSLERGPKGNPSNIYNIPCKLSQFYRSIKPQKEDYQENPTLLPPSPVS